MVKRKRLGLVYSYNENWVAGSYYILNIIHALNTVEDKLKPEVILLTNSQENFEKVKTETQYPYIKHCILPFQANYSFLERGANKFFKAVLKKKLINKPPKLPKLDFLYPKQIKGLSNTLKKVNWIPDFQEEHLPQFFSQEEITRRKDYQKQVLVNSDIVVFSSQDAKKDFERLYPASKAQLFVLPFAVTHPDFSHEKIEDLYNKYDLPRDYFFAPNQFWAHKNHIVILKAVKRLKEKGVNVVVAFSGKESDHRNLENFNKLKSYIIKNKLEDQIKFLGFINREEQLCLLNKSIAIIQPSLFEGWSTVVEDAKALNKLIILSNIEVHKEQIKLNAQFFDPQNEITLVQILNKYYNKKPNIVNVDYKKNVRNFGKKFIELINLSTN
jgi:glycosyltransferase involved in cell wall biosynthesis